MITGIADTAVLRTCELFLGIELAPLRRAIRRRGEVPTVAALLAEIGARGLADLDEVREALRPVRALALAWGAAAVRRQGLRYVMRDGVMVTVRPAALDDRVLDG